MSDLIKKAITDAKALSELAVKKAEERMISTHSQAIKGAVGKILEQRNPTQIPSEEDFEGEDFFADLDAEMGGGEGHAAALDPGLSAQIPQASTEGGQACPCSDEQDGTKLGLDAIVFDFEDLEKEMQNQEDEVTALEENLRHNLEEGEDKEDKDSPESDDKKEDDKEESEEKSDDKREDGGEEKDGDKKEEDDDKGEEENLSEALISEEDIQSIVTQVTEEIKMHIKEVPHGHTGRLTAPEAEVWTDIQKAMAVQANKTKKLQEQFKTLAGKYQAVEKQLTEAREIHSQELTQVVTEFEKMTGVIEEGRFENAKLSAANRVLLKNNLNERQKEQVLKSIDGATSLSEVQAVFKSAMMVTESQSGAMTGLRFSNNAMLASIRKNIVSENIEDDSEKAPEKHEDGNFVLSENVKRMQEKAGIRK